MTANTFLLTILLGLSSVLIAKPELQKRSAFKSSLTLAKGIDIDMELQLVRIPVTLVNDQCPGLEFLVTKGTDKDYEAIFSTNINARDLHMALLIVELSASDNLNSPPQNDSLVELTLEFKGQHSPIEDWLSWSDGRAVDDLGLYFKGSGFSKIGKTNTYLADLALNIISAWSCYDMLIGPSVEVGNPYTEEGPPHLIAKSELPVAQGEQGFLYLGAKR